MIEKIITRLQNEVYESRESIRRADGLPDAVIEYRTARHVAFKQALAIVLEVVEENS